MEQLQRWEGEKTAHLKRAEQRQRAAKEGHCAEWGCGHLLTAVWVRKLTKA